MHIIRYVLPSLHSPQTQNMSNKRYLSVCRLYENDGPPTLRPKINCTPSHLTVPKWTAVPGFRRGVNEICTLLGCYLA